MAATARQIPVTQDDLDGGGGGLYAEIEVPADYEAVLKSVEDYDKTAKGKGFGWKWTYTITTSRGGTVDFDVYLSFSDAARWKMIEVLAAHEVPLEDGLNSVDPNAYVEDTIGVTIDFPRDEDDVPTSTYREIRAFFTLADALVPTVNDVAEAFMEKAQEEQESNEWQDGPKFGEEVPAAL